MGGHLQRLQGVHAEVVVDALGQGGPDAGHGLEDLLGVEVAAQALELAPAAAADELPNRRGDAAADVGDGGQPVEALLPEDLVQGSIEPGHGTGRTPVRADAKGVRPLLREQVSRLLQSVRHLGVDGAAHLRPPSSQTSRNH